MKVKQNCTFLTTLEIKLAIVLRSKMSAFEK